MRGHPGPPERRRGRRLRVPRDRGQPGVEPDQGGAPQALGALPGAGGAGLRGQDQAQAVRRVGLAGGWEGQAPCPAGLKGTSTHIFTNKSWFKLC